MAYRRPIKFAEGETLMACSLCGFSYLYPSELRYCDDKLFRCNRTCWDGETPKSWEERSQAARRRVDNDTPPLAGPKPGWR